MRVVAKKTQSVTVQSENQGVSSETIVRRYMSDRLMRTHVVTHHLANCGREIWTPC